MKFKRGDILVNMWTPEDSLMHKRLYMRNGTVVSPYNGIHKSRYRLKDLESDHFIKIGHCNIDEMFKEMLDRYNETK